MSIPSIGQMLMVISEKQPPYIPTAYPVYRGSGVYTNLFYNMSATYPTELYKDEILIALVGQYSGAISSTPPTGWNHIYNTYDSLWGRGLFWKRATGNESGLVSFNTPSAKSATAGIMYRFSGCATSGVPFDISNTTTISSNFNSFFTVPATTTTLSNNLVTLFINAFPNNSNAVTGIDEYSVNSNIIPVGKANFVCADNLKITAGTVPTDDIYYANWYRGTAIVLNLKP